MELERLLLRLRGESTWLVKEARRTQLSARWRGVVESNAPSSSSAAGCETAASIGYLARGDVEHRDSLRLVEEWWGMGPSLPRIVLTREHDCLPDACCVPAHDGVQRVLVDDGGAGVVSVCLKLNVLAYWLSGVCTCS
jgi:hypothetical protein